MPGDVLERAGSNGTTYIGRRGSPRRSAATAPGRSPFRPSPLVPDANHEVDGDGHRRLPGNGSAEDATAFELTVDTDRTRGADGERDRYQTNTAAPVISRARPRCCAGEILTLTVDGVTYTAGDGALVDNGDGTWDARHPCRQAG